jgi:LDH2 family malate/lactate/ureidoglycolate dehydrogenase
MGCHQRNDFGESFYMEEVHVIMDVLLYAQMRDNNQGEVKLIDKRIPKDPKAGEIVIEKETPISARINGNKNHAMIVVRRAVDIVEEKVRTTRFAIARTFNTDTSSGAIGYYASRLAKQGLIGFTFSRSHRSAAVHGSYEPVFGTNPLAMGSDGVGSHSFGCVNSGDFLLTDLRELAKNISAMVRKVKSTKKLQGVEKIFVPGEKESRLARERQETGLINVEDNLLAALHKVAVV